MTVKILHSNQLAERRPMDNFRHALPDPGGHRHRGPGHRHQGISHVINYDVPSTEGVLHRAGPHELGVQGGLTPSFAGIPGASARDHRALSGSPDYGVPQTCFPAFL